MKKIILTILTGALVSSCTPAQMAAWPVAIGIKQEGVEASYSAKGGLVITVDQKTGK